MIQYQQNMTSYLKPLNTKKEQKDHNVWHWKSRSWLRAGTNMWQS